MVAFLNNPVEWIFVMVVLLVLFGPQKLPEIGRQLGQALRDLKRSTQEFSNQLHADDDDRRDSSYNGSRYNSYSDSYENAYDSTYQNDFNRSTTDERTEAQKAIEATNTAPPKGDFAAAAFTESSADFGTPSATTASNTGQK